jgi:hypothetical protein
MTAVAAERCVTVTFPGTAWMAVFLSHFDWAIDALEANELAPDERLNVARQLVILHEAASQGAPASVDDLITELREMLDTALVRLGYTRTAADGRLTKSSVYRADDLRSLLRKLVKAGV